MLERPELVHTLKDHVALNTLPEVRDRYAFLFAGASRSASGSTPADDGLFMSVVQTFRDLRPSEFPLAQPYRIKVVTATEGMKLDEYAKKVPVEKYQKEELQLLNALYPNREPTAGSPVKVVE